MGENPISLIIVQGAVPRTPLNWMLQKTDLRASYHCGSKGFWCLVGNPFESDAVGVWVGHTSRANLTYLSLVPEKVPRQWERTCFRGRTGQRSPPFSEAKEPMDTDKIIKETPRAVRLLLIKSKSNSFI